MNLSTKNRLLILNIFIVLLIVVIFIDSILNLEGRDLFARCIRAIPHLTFIILMLMSKRRILKKAQDNIDKNKND